ncbi:MAG TPA: hypothetical protein VF012_00805 [Nocardioidaceae bacterium]
MNKRITVRIVAGSLATAVLGLAAFAAPAQADSAWGPTSSKGGAGTYRIIG